MDGRDKICCNCSKFTSARSPEDDELGCCLALVSVEIKVLSRGIVELEGEGEREREREREVITTRYCQQTKGQHKHITSNLQHEHTFLGTTFA